MKKFSFVLPIKIDTTTNFLGGSIKKDYDSIDRLIDIQLKTIDKFLDKQSLDKFYIICVDSELKQVQERVTKSYPDLPFVFKTESEVLPELKTQSWSHMTNPNWMLQQLLKMNAAKFVATEFYIILDTDVFMTQPFSYDDCFYNDKYICNVIDDFGTKPTKEKWWQHAIAILSPDVEEVTFDKNSPSGVTDKIMNFNSIMGVTPVIYDTKQMLSLFDEIERMYNMNYNEFLIKQSGGHPNTWIEMSIYWTWLVKQGIWDDLYDCSGPNLYGNELWRSADDVRMGKALDIYYTEFEKVFDGTYEVGGWNDIVGAHQNIGKYYFSLAQSNIRQLDWNVIKNKINEILI